MRKNLCLRMQTLGPPPIMGGQPTLVLSKRHPLEGFSNPWIVPRVQRMGDSKDPHGRVRKRAMACSKKLVTRASLQSKKLLVTAKAPRMRKQMRRPLVLLQRD